MSLTLHGFVSMLELLCPLSPPVIDSSHMVMPLLDLLCDLPGFTPSRYDLNQHDSWRAFDLEKTHVDSLSQRVQLLRVQGEDPAHLAMLSTGKAGETPTFIVRTPEAPMAELIAAITPHLDAIPMRWLIMTSALWRQTVCDDASPALSPLMVWPVDDEPAPLSTDAHASFARHTHTHTTLWKLSNHVRAPDATHLAALRAITR